MIGISVHRSLKLEAAPEEPEEALAWSSLTLRQTVPCLYVNFLFESAVVIFCRAFF